MAETFYVSVVWTAGDVITEAKLDNMVANDRAVDSMQNGIQFVERADPSTPSTNNLHLYAKDKSGIPTLYVINDAGTIYEIAESTPTYEFPLTGTLFVATLAAGPLGVIRDSIITRARLYVNTAPTGADLICDVNKNGTSIWNSTPANRVKVVAGQNAGTQTSFDITTLSADDIFTVDIDQVGSTVSGADGVLFLKTK